MSSSSPSGNGHFNPTASARLKYSLTVLWEIWQLRAIDRFDKPHSHFKRNASLIFRMDNLSCDITTSWNYSRDSLPHFKKIIQRHSPMQDSAPCRPPIPLIPKKWTACSGISGRHAPDSVDGLLRIHWPPWTGLRNKLTGLGRNSH